MPFCKKKKVSKFRKELKCKDNIKRNAIIFLLLLCCAAAFCDDLVPSELNSFATSLQDTAQGTIVRMILGLCAIGVGIGLAFTKDSQKAKMSGVAVIIGGAIVMFGPNIVESIMKTT